MIPQRLTALRAVLLIVAVLLTVTVFPAWGVPADLVLVLVVAVGLGAGPQVGALFALVAGLLVDLVPPGSAPLGLSALLYAAVGAVAGVFRRSVRASVLVPVIGVLFAVAAIQTVRLLTSFVGSQRLDLAHAAATVVLTVIVGAVIVPVVMRVEHYLRQRGLA